MSLPHLPVSEVLDELSAALSTAGKAVLVAPPGAGKTTLVPLHLLQSGLAGSGRILLLEPRRLAARAAARRMASLLGEEVGGTVGYAMRMDSKSGPNTRVLVVTEGILARMILDDPELAGISAILFDEFHERSLDGDFGLALALDVAGALRPDLKLLVMSATIDGARVASLLGEAPVITSEGRSFPVEIRHRDRPSSVKIEDAMADAIRSVLADETGSILAFLPGQREIERTCERLEGRIAADCDIIPLFGGLVGKAQDEAIRPPAPGRRKIVLATSIAETSITIDGVRIVIDSGLARVPKFEPATGLTRLETVRASRASADQRAGRAGRTEPGIAIRLWRAEQTASLCAFSTPEILEADLSGLLLDAAAFGVTDPATLAFLDPPPTPALAEARALLDSLGALDAQGRLTDAGERMRRLALPVRLAHMVAEAPDPRLAARLAVLLTERGLGGTGVDLDTRLRRFAHEKGQRADAARDLAKRLGSSSTRPPPRTPSRKGEGDTSASASPDNGPSGPSPTPGTMLSNQEPTPTSPSPLWGGVRGGGLTEKPSTSPGATLLLAYPDRVARARGAHGHFVLANGRGGTIDAADSLAAAPFVVVADLQGRAQNARIASAVAICENDIREALADRIETTRETQFDAVKGSVRVREVERLGAIVLAERQLPAPKGPEADRAILDAVRQHGIAILPWDKSSETLRARLGWLHRGLGDPWPDVSDDALAARLDDWLAPFLTGEANLARLPGSALHNGLMSLVPYELHRKLETLAPTHYDAPSGSRLPIRYDADWPVLAIRVQELFGLDAHPSIANGTVPMTLELLSPAHRPIQTTRDLPGFWRGSWADVRVEMRGRYPKHVWPANPLEAKPTARAKPRGT
ncbi:ATP-dependent helicase HrpB [Aliihoeflea sp. 40Bstr573]|uniref:ATP-dependent helicase HrpB n=1 Tax=Aliihoeflea sp. 40Bstr573 TaxID=2696467 RepID=UPI0020944EBC|nr:ATP-dependent helicase HrpB [Aliihoeflea sp. 40Bstr573]MCO6387354.1 ATP-dependent helicase HrpB [Aliihoeflea sp. 40Bstr573]